MEPMKPMKPMEPMKGTEPWWPEDLGKPATSGAQNGMKYAFFPDKRRLIIDKDGQKTTYDTGDHKISGVSQQDSGKASLAFSSQNGTVDLSSLKTV